ncbi:hypothetical protein AB0M02_45645 [Actinoplanes sp. NPDC051861]|uniref:hypothetical protein n=1 Tax=Actinoplanes sp. NPDC051861 TaxID=3155170 RepID=UPI00341CAE71
MMDLDEVAERLAFEWSPDGFLAGLRSGRFEPDEADRFLSVLESVDPADPRRFEPRIVGRLWAIPFYMLSHIQNSESLGLDTRERRRVLWRANEILAVVFTGEA